jgi:serine/threonine-protein kinase
MEFIDGRSICDIVERDGPMPPARVEHILRQVCGSLAEAHKKGIVHRDLKPDNVVLTTRAGEADFAKVLDFGIAARTEATDAKKEQKLTQQGTVLGTPPYMSPEQFTGKELDGRSDIYSLGVMAYEMLTGKLPFEAETPWEWATKHLTERPYPFEVTAPRTAMIPEPMKGAIMRALAKNREERQPDIMAFFDELSGNAPVAYQAAGTAPAATTGTAAMAAPPPELMQAAPGYSPPAYGHAPTASDMVMPVQAPAYAAPQAQKSGGGAKFMILGIVGLLLVGGVVGAVVLVRGMSTSADDDNGMNLGLPSATGITEIAPLASATSPEASVDEADAGPAPTHTATATVRPTATATATATKKKLEGEAACQQSIQSAKQGAIESAVGLYRVCQKGGSSAAQAHHAIRTNAKSAAERAKFNGDCKRAKSIAASASSIGADGGATAVANSCK